MATVINSERGSSGRNAQPTDSNRGNDGLVQFRKKERELWKGGQRCREHFAAEKFDLPLRVERYSRVIFKGKRNN